VEKAIKIARRAGIPLKIAAKVDKADLDCYNGNINGNIKRLLKGPGVEFIGEGLTGFVLTASTGRLPQFRVSRPLIGAGFDVALKSGFRPSAWRAIMSSCTMMSGAAARSKRLS
jgi:hypothetical protein